MSESTSGSGSGPAPDPGAGNDAPSGNGSGKAEDNWEAYWRDRSAADFLAGEGYDFRRDAFEAIAEAVDPEGASVMEAGCGAGRFARWFEARGAEVTLFDMSPSALGLSRELVEDPAGSVQGDLRSTPFPDGAFDVVFNEGVIEHFDGDERQGVVDEMVRVTAPGGRIAVIVPNRWAVPYRLNKWVEQRRGTWQWGYEQPFSAGELRERFERAGVTTDEVGGVRLLPLPESEATLGSGATLAASRRVSAALSSLQGGSGPPHRLFAQYLYYVGTRG